MQSSNYSPERTYVNTKTGQSGSNLSDGPVSAGPGSEFLIEPSEYKITESFEEMGLKTEVLRGIFAYGFERPSPIQQKAITPLAEGRDLIAQAQSGMGKTATFSIGTLQRIDTSLNQMQAIIVTTTRELADQTRRVLAALGDYMGVRCAVCIGGTIVRNDERALAAGVHVVVGTPGRILDLIRRRSLRSDTVRLAVFDEADKLLSADGMQAQLHDLFTYLPPSVQIALFSATMPPSVLSLSSQFLRDPVRILVEKEALTLAGIRQYYVMLDRDDHKLDCLLDLYANMSIAQSIIFCNTRARVEKLSESLSREQFVVSSISAGMEQKEREEVMRAFRSGSSRVLVATDLVARGIDVQTVSLVFNVDIPSDKEDYLHRIGRSGRFGRKGVAINFVTPRDLPLFKAIEAHYKCTMHELPSDVSDVLND